jgi:hypothetical protein
VPLEPGCVPVSACVPALTLRAASVNRATTGVNRFIATVNRLVDQFSGETSG